MENYGIIEIKIYFTSSIVISYIYIYSLMSNYPANFCTFKFCINEINSLYHF